MAISLDLTAPFLVGALLNLDRQVFGQFMVSRPLVSGFIIGLLTGELWFGAWMGLSVELLWLGLMPLGGKLTPNAGLAVSAALIAWVRSSFTAAVGVDFVEAGLVISFLTVPLWAWAFTYIDTICRRLAVNQLTLAQKDLAEGHEPQFFKRNIMGFWSTFGISLVALILAVQINSVILGLVARFVPEIVLLNFRFIFAFIPFLGLMGMAVFMESKTINYYFGGLLASLLALSAVM